MEESSIENYVDDDEEKENEYRRYISLAGSLPIEMITRGIQETYCFMGNVKFTVYVDGTADLPSRDQSLLTRIGLCERKMENIDLSYLGKMLYHLIPDKSRYRRIPFNLDNIHLEDLKELNKSLSISEKSVVRHGKVLIEV